VPPTTRAVTAVKILGLLSWAALTIGVTALVLAEPGTDTTATRVNTITAVFATMLIQLIVAAIAWRRRRRALLTLTAAITLWSIGSASLNSAPTETQSFPGPGEWFFLSAVGGLAAYVILDARGNRTRSLVAWLEAGIGCGGAASLAGLLVITPLAQSFPRQGLPLLTALIYPLLDVMLIMLVVGQLTLRLRRADRRTILLGIALLGLTAADSSLVLSLSTGMYAVSLLADVTWVVSFLLLTASAVSRISVETEDVEGPATPGASLRNSRVVVVAAGVALLTLTFRPTPSEQLYVAVPAALTLLASGLRLVLALRQAQQATEARRLSRTDDLTELPNRRAMETWLSDRLATPQPLSLLLLDLDGFKDVNDSLGHAAGDDILRRIGRRLSDTASLYADHARVARLGGDEFAVIVTEDAEDRLIGLAGSLSQAIARPLHVDGLQLSLEASTGVAVRTPEIVSGVDLLRQADIAMYQAKSARAGTMVYDPSRDEFSRERLQLAEELREGIRAGELDVWYQPQVDASTGRPCAVEALVRWRHPTQGLLQPYVFLPLARRAGLMAALTGEVLSRAIGDAIRWRAAGLPLRVAVNVAPPELLTDGVMQRLFEDVDASGLPERTVTVEVTEESFLADPDRAKRAIAQLREHGLEVSLDDYGTGYSCTAYLRELHLNELKIDREFVKDLLDDDASKIIVAATNQLAHGLGMRTVAEGVENEKIAAHLAGIGVDVLQGYHYARPMPAAEVTSWMAERNLVRPTVD
jgi:diguanylate cyclase